MTLMGENALCPRLGRFIVAAAMLSAGFATSRIALGVEPSTRGGRVAWGRMITKGDWSMHSDRDPDLAKFIRKQTSLNIDPTWYSANPSQLADICRYPLLYVKSLTYVPSRTDLENIREYLNRGGFLCIDPCIAHQNLEALYRDNSNILEKLIPDGELRELPASHPIYHCYFDVKAADIFTPDMGPHVSGKHEGVYGIFHGDRMIAVISLYGLECGWPQTPMRTPGCMKMIVNIYVYAMTQAAEAPVRIR